ncbi:MAG TPA: hypothetical protein VHR40_02740 [Thermoleophilaceae bacterium]|jgi:hypothetical protein|nr:hypothetical protein [Thermoleophilaceae bacterium]
MRLLLLAALAAALGPSPAQDSVTGTAGRGDARDAIDFAFDVHSGPSGENPTGTVVLRLQLGQPTTLTASCLDVEGNRARMIVPAPPHAGIAGLSVAVQDTGPGGLDKFDWEPLQTLPTGCPVPATVPSFVERGDVVVTDAPPPPTTFAQCRLGGWVKFGFDSHAACSAYVHQRARDACIFERVAHGIVAFRAKYGLGPDQDHAMRHCVRLRTGW